MYYAGAIAWDKKKYGAIAFPTMIKMSSLNNNLLNAP
jgi:hypothetical protein